MSSPLYTDKGSITSPKFGFSETLLQNKHTYPVCYKNSVNQLQGSFPRTHFWIYASLPVKQLNEIFWEIFSHATSPKCCQNMSEFRIAWFTCKKHEDYQVAVLISIQFKIVHKIKFQSSGSPFSYFAYLPLLSNYFPAYDTIVRYRSKSTHHHTFLDGRPTDGRVKICYHSEYTAFHRASSCQRFFSAATEKFLQEIFFGY